MLKQNVVDQFFLRTFARFNDYAQTARQRLTRCHAFVHAGFFRGLIELNDGNFCSLGVD